jgi:hypothetical protein
MSEWRLPFPKPGEDLADKPRAAIGPSRPYNATEQSMPWVQSAIGIVFVGLGVWTLAWGFADMRTLGFFYLAVGLVNFAVVGVGWLRRRSRPSA